jgi:hypothetical protein
MRWTIRHLGVALACCFVLSACEPASETLPAEMLQAWHSDAPGYEYRSFELRDDWVIFGTGLANSDMFKLEHVQSEADSAGGRRYTIRYTTMDGESVAVEIIHRPGPHTTLKFANHNEVWTPGFRPLEGV